MKAINKSLLALGLGGFGIGMTEFVIMGILPEIANSLNISIPEAGHLISSYALGVVLGAPLLVALASNYPPKKILVGLMVMFTIFNGLSSLAPNYSLLFVSRLFAGLPHGAFFGVGAVVASRLAPKGKAAQYISMMFLGLTIANIIGVPFGTFVGQHLSFRASFALVAVVGFLTILALKAWMPELAVHNKRNLKQDLKLFTHVEPWFAIAITSIGTGGLFAWFSYIAPLLTEVSGFHESSLTWILMIAGIGMTCGNIIGGRLADKLSPLKSIIVLFLCMTVSLLIISMVAESKTLVVLMTFVTGVFAFSVGAPIQMLIIKNAYGSEMIASSLGQASFNIGNTIGAYFGGIPIAMGLGFTSPQWVGAGLAFSGAMIAVAMFIYQRVTSPKHV